MANRKITDEEFLSRHIPEPNTGCWLWTGNLDSDGYGTCGAARNTLQKAHRRAWALETGTSPEGLLVCHKCDTRSCVNPAHLFLGSAKDNTSDMLRKRRHASQTKTHCVRGHSFAAVTGYVRKSGVRGCLLCDRIRDRSRKRRSERS